VILSQFILNRNTRSFLATLGVIETIFSDSVLFSKHNKQLNAKQHNDEPHLVERPSITSLWSCAKILLQEFRHWFKSLTFFDTSQ